MHHRISSIMHLIDSGGIYGIERMLIDLLPKLQEHGYDVALTCMSRSGTQGARIGDVLINSGIKVFYADFSSKFGIRGILSLMKNIRFFKPNILHLHGYKATIFGGLLGLLLGIPLVGTYHAEAKHAANLSKQLQIETLFIRRMKHVAAVSVPIKEELKKRGVPSARISIIRNGIKDPYKDIESAKKFREMEGFNPLLLFVGRLIEKKNVHILIDAISVLKRDLPDIGLVIAGDGQFREKLQKQVNKLQLSNSVVFLGYVEDVYSLYKRCDCFVLPSKTEGMPICVLEAMSLHCPIVASSVGSIPSILQDGRDAILVEPNNKEALCEALTYLFKNRLLVKSLRISARRKFLLKYTSTMMTDKYVEIYNNVKRAAFLSI